MNLKHSIKKVLNTLNSIRLKNTIYDLLDTDAVRIDVVDNRETCVYRPHNTFLRLISTRELLTDEIRDTIMSKWEDALSILSKYEQLKTRFDFSLIDGLCVWQMDWGFDPNTHELKEDCGVTGYYRWIGCGV